VERADTRAGVERHPFRVAAARAGRHRICHGNAFGDGCVREYAVLRVRPAIEKTSVRTASSAASRRST
jgi:hypothetical protein